MKQLIIIILVNFAITIFAQVPSCPSHYTDWDELNILLSNLEDEYSDILRVDTLITTNTDNLPVYGVKLSNNVDIKEDKPRLLFVGTCHAEEVMGTEVVLSQIKTICENRNQYPYSYWLQALELWFVPTMNPEGMRIVFGYEEDNPYFESQIGEWYEDGSFRKNRTDVNENNYFDYEPLQVGFDLDGVDLNRNYSFNWVHGDSLYHVGSTSEVYDYYRGAEPLSEAETQAIDQLAEENNFVYSIHWHTSRTGNFSEKCYYSFDWYRNIDTGQSYRPSPDLDIGEELAQNAASRIANQAGDGSYEWHASSGRKGGEHDFMYQKHGTFQLLIECATSNHQPDSLLMEDTIERCMVGQEWLINRALPFHADIENRSILTGHITDANSGEPLEAEIVVSGRSARYLAPRMSDEVGRYWRPLLGGLYDVTIQKEGYESQTIDDLLINQSGWTTQDFALVPLPEINFNCIVQTDGEPIASSIKINGIYEHEYFSENGIFDISFFVGEYEIEVNSDNCYPFIGTILFDGNTFSEIDLSPQDIIYDEDWESGIQDWSVNGEWQLIENLEEGGFCITDSWGGNGFYEPNCDWDIVSGAIDLTEDNMLSFDQRIYTEWDFDFVTVEVSSDQTSWDVLYQNSGMFDFWDRVNISLSEYNNQQIYLRFHITADSPNVNLVDPGWMIDDIRIYSGSSSIVENENDAIVPQQQIYLSQNYPNPFNPTTKIPFYISSDFNEANLSIYNILGQEIKSYNISEEDNKKGFLVWEANKNATGVYFYKLTVDNKLTKTKKAILLK